MFRAHHVLQLSKHLKVISHFMSKLNNFEANGQIMFKNNKYETNNSPKRKTLSKQGLKA